MSKNKKGKDKKKFKLKNVTPQQWKDAGEALTGAAAKLGKARSDERAKTQALKDQLYIKRNKNK